MHPCRCMRKTVRTRRPDCGVRAPKGPAPGSPTLFRDFPQQRSPVLPLLVVWPSLHTTEAPLKTPTPNQACTRPMHSSDAPPALGSHAGQDGGAAAPLVAVHAHQAGGALKHLCTVADDDVLRRGTWAVRQNGCGRLVAGDVASGGQAQDEARNTRCGGRVERCVQRATWGGSREPLGQTAAARRIGLWKSAAGAPSPCPSKAPHMHRSRRGRRMATAAGPGAQSSGPARPGPADRR